MLVQVPFPASSRESAWLFLHLFHIRLFKAFTSGMHGVTLRHDLFWFASFSHIPSTTFMFIRVNNVLFETLTTFCKFMRKANSSQKEIYIFLNSYSLQYLSGCCAIFCARYSTECLVVGTQ